MSFTVLWKTYSIPFLLSLLPLTVAVLGYWRKVRLPIKIKAKRLPGPKGWPLIGNIGQLPFKYSWLSLSEMTKVYGDLIYIRKLNRRVLFIHSSKIARDLLSKRARLYSGRPHFEMNMKIVGFDRVSPGMPYNSEWKDQRAILSQTFNMRTLSSSSSATGSSFATIQLREAYTLVSACVTSSEEQQDAGGFVDLINLHMTRIMTQVTYGSEPDYQETNKNERQKPLPSFPLCNSDEADTPTYLEDLRKNQDWIKKYPPGSFLVDIIPQLSSFLSNISFVPSTKLGKEWRELLDRLAWRPYRFEKARWERQCQELTEGEEHEERKGGSLVARALASASTNVGGKDLSLEDENAIIYAGLSTMGAGIETVSSAIQTFVLLMLLYPDIQLRAQGEIGKALGSERLPCSKDWDLAMDSDEQGEGFCYIRALIAEVLRWGCPAPLGLPHYIQGRDPDGYEGYDIKDCIVMVNIWHILHNSETYPSPSEFRPDRFLGGEEGEKEKQKEVLDVVFGFGRRSCPGNHLAQQTLFNVITTILTTCDIVPVLNAAGEPIFPLRLGKEKEVGVAEWKDVFCGNQPFMFPKRFKCKFVWRNERCERLVRDSLGL